VYGLAGANIEPGEVDALISPRRRSHVLRDYGWDPNGKFWLWFKLSKGMLSNGAFTVPAGAQRFLAGRFELKANDKSTIGTVVCKEGSGWGLGPFYTRRGGEPGDHLLLLFDLSTREAIVEIGDESLFDGIAVFAQTLDPLAAETQAGCGGVQEWRCH